MADVLTVISSGSIIAQNSLANKKNGIKIAKNIA